MNMKDNTRARFKKTLVGSSVVVGMIVLIVLVTAGAYAAGPESSEGPGVKRDPDVLRWAFMSAAIVASVSCVGAGIAVAYVGSAALGTIGEKPELFGRAIIFVGLAEGIAIYGLIVAIIILFQV